MRASSAVFKDVKEVHELEKNITLWFRDMRCMSHAEDYKYWKASIHYPFASNRERLYCVLKYIEVVQQDDCFCNLISGYQISEIYLKRARMPSLIKQSFRNVNERLCRHILSVYPFMGWIAIEIFKERKPLFEN